MNDHRIQIHFSDAGRGFGERPEREEQTFERRHVYAYYLGKPSQPIKLYTPYNNRECLHCHLGARSFEESEAHAKDPQMLSRIKANQLSCSTSECHNIIHNVGQLKDATFWKEPAQ